MIDVQGLGGAYRDLIDYAPAGKKISFIPPVVACPDRRIRALAEATDRSGKLLDCGQISSDVEAKRLRQNA